MGSMIYLMIIILFLVLILWTCNNTKNFENKCLKDLEKIRDKILSIFKKYSDSPFNIPNLLKQITTTEDFQDFTDTLAKRFFARCVQKNNDTFRKSYFGRAYQIFKNLTGDEDLITFIRNQVDEKANLFKSIPVELANSLIPHVNEWALEGKTSKGIFDDLKLNADTASSLWKPPNECW